MKNMKSAKVRKHKRKKFLHKSLPWILCFSMAANSIIVSAADPVEDTSAGTPEITVTVTVTDNNNGTSTESTVTTETWTDQNTTGTPVDPQAPPVEGSSSVTTTTTTGSETTVDSTTTDDQNRVVEESNSVNGSETTTTEKVTTNVTIDENQTIVDTTTTTTTVNGEVTSVVTDGVTVETGEAGPDSTSSDDYSTGWINGTTPEITGNEETGWTEGNVVYKDAADQTNDPAADETKTTLEITDPTKNGDITLTMTPGGTDTETVTTTTIGELVSENINMPETGSKTDDVKDADSNVIGKTVTQIKDGTDENGNPITIVTKTTTTNSSKTEHPTPDSVDDVVEGPTETFVLPEKPAASTKTDSATGNTTATAVEDIIDAAGKHVGYRSITVVTNNGAELSRSTNEVYGTTITTTKTTATVPTGSDVTTKTETTTVETTTYSGTQTQREVELDTQKYVELQKKIETSKEYQFIEVDGNLYFVYTAEMGTPYNDDGHGTISNVTNVAPDMSLVNGSGGVNLKNKDLYQKNDASNGNYGSYAEFDKSDYKYKLVGNGLASKLEVATKNDSTIVHQFKLVDNKGKADRRSGCGSDPGSPLEIWQQR